MLGTFLLLILDQLKKFSTLIGTSHCVTNIETESRCIQLRPTYERSTTQSSETTLKQMSLHNSKGNIAW